MNREIKFRAFATDLKKTVYGYLVDDVEWAKTWIYYPIKKSPFIEMYGALVDKKTVGQFTGLTDKNGKEIYEGDLLFYAATNHSSMVVKFEHGSFVGEGPFNTLPLSQYLSATDFEFIEVIGNIYATPELLCN